MSQTAAVGFKLRQPFRTHTDVAVVLALHSGSGRSFTLLAVILGVELAVVSMPSPQVRDRVIVVAVEACGAPPPVLADPRSSAQLALAWLPVVLTPPGFPVRDPSAAIHQEHLPLFDSVSRTRRLGREHTCHVSIISGLS